MTGSTGLVGTQQAPSNPHHSWVSAANDTVQWGDLIRTVPTMYCSMYVCMCINTMAMEL